MRDIVVDLGDAHSVNCMGVHPPYFHKRLGSDHESTKPEMWLWECWLALRDYALGLKRAREDRLHVVFNGDLGDSAWKHPTHQLVTYDLADAVDLAVETVDPWLQYADDWFLSAGTEAHAGCSGELEAEIAARIGATPLPSDPKQRVWDIVRLDLQGIKLDFAHTGKVGARTWTQTNALGGLYGDVLTFYAEEKQPLPDIASFSHVHKATDSGDNFEALRVLTTPGWLLRAYHYNRSPYRRCDIGGSVIVIDDGEVTLVKNKKFKASAGLGGIERWRAK